MSAVRCPGPRRGLRTVSPCTIPSRQYAPALLPAVVPVAVPVGSGIIEMGVFRHLHRNTTFPDRTISAVTFPSGPMRGGRQKCVCRHADGGAGPADGAISTIAFPAGASRGTDQVAVQRHTDSDALQIDRSISAITFPAFAGGIQVSVRRDLHRSASVFDFSISPTALPAASIGRARQVCIRGGLDGGAGSFDLSKATITLPPVPITLCVGVLRHTGSANLCEHNSGENHHKNYESDEVKQGNRWSSDLSHRSFLHVGAAFHTRPSCGRRSRALAVLRCQPMFLSGAIDRHLRHQEPVSADGRASGPRRDRQGQIVNICLTPGVRR